MTFFIKDDTNDEMKNFFYQDQRVILFRRLDFAIMPSSLNSDGMNGIEL